MSDYPLKPLAHFLDGPGDRKGTGMMIDCPNCGAPGSVWFSNPLDGGPPVHPTVWQRTGDTFETMTLHPSVKMFGHFHSWVRNGMLSVDSPFEAECERIKKMNETTETPAVTETPATEPTPAPPAPETPQAPPETPAPAEPTPTAPAASSRPTTDQVCAELRELAGVLNFTANEISSVPTVSFAVSPLTLNKWAVRLRELAAMGEAD